MVRKSVKNYMSYKIAGVLLRLDHVAHFIVNTNHGAM